ncbi:hypothetical protein L7F22_036550 [Adiantum nelumboides]|nr:hypothetical protein [Adiantum nelumboides]
MSASTSTAVGATPLCIHPPAFTEGKLDGTNYTLWKFKIFAILDSYELLDTVLGPNGADPEPVATIDSTNPSAAIPPDATLLCAWRRRNADALCAIVMCLSDFVLTLVQHTTKAHEAWNILARQYEAHNQCISNHGSVLMRRRRLLTQHRLRSVSSCHCINIRPDLISRRWRLWWSCWRSLRPFLHIIIII